MPEKTKDSYYFSHDSNARNDPKILKLMRQLGAEGYGIFWMIIEVLREQASYTLPLSSMEDLAFQFHVSKEKIQAVVEGYGLFIVENESFYSARLIRSMSIYDERKRKIIEASKKGNAKRWKKSLGESGRDPDGSRVGIALNDRILSKGNELNDISFSTDISKQIDGDINTILNESSGNGIGDTWGKIKSILDNHTTKNISVQSAANIWNFFASVNKLAVVKTISQKHIDDWQKAVSDRSFDYMPLLKKVQESEFLMNKSDSPFKASFGYIIQEKNYTRILNEEVK